MQAILVGFGEIGRGIAEAYSDKYIEIYDPMSAPVKPSGKFDLLLVAIPYSDDFVKIVSNYQKEFGVKATVIFSTVPIGTTQKLNAVHSPVEGRHPHLAESIRYMPRWIGGENEIVNEFFSDIKTVVVDSPEYTEFLKLQSTTKYGVNIEFARYAKGVSDALGMDFELVKSFDQDYNDLYKHLGLPQFQRYILDPPEGKIGGHCVGPNSIILDKQYPNNLVKEVKKWAV